MAYSSAERWSIIRTHMDTHGGVLNAEEFLAAATNSNHPAHDWYEWDDSKAAHAHRLQQTRQFYHIVIDKNPPQKVSGGNVEYTTLPAVVSPLESRWSKKPYYIAADTPEGHEALLEEFAASIENWMDKRRGILSKTQVTAVEKAVRSLRVKAVRKSA